MTFGHRLDAGVNDAELTYTQRSLIAATVSIGRGVVLSDTGVQHGPACEACATFASHCLCRPYAVQS